MKILVLAPDVDLSTLNELLSTMTGMTPEVLKGIVSKREAMQRLVYSDCTALHIVTHGSQRDILLSDGALDSELLSVAAAEKRVPIELFFGNYCDSIYTAAQLYERGVSYAIGWDGSGDDRILEEFAQTFYSTLVLNNFNIHAAFETAQEYHRRLHPEHRSAILLNGRIPRRDAKMADLQMTVDKLTAENVELRTPKRFPTRWQVVFMIAWMLAITAGLLVLLMGR